jgi:O-antigen/teichoic acid export membrane protein
MLGKTYVLITSWVFRLALPSFIVLLVFPRELLSVFGRGFTAGATLTVILTLGQLVNSTTGPGGYMLIMSGRPAIQMANNVGALVFNIVLNLWLMPRYGGLGAAIAWATTIAAFNILRVFEVWRFARMVPLSRDLLKGLAAGVAAGLVGLAVRGLMDGLPSLAVGVVMIGAAYVAGLAALGIDADDRLVLDTLRRRLRLRNA